MASDKKRRKASKADRKSQQPPPAGAFRHLDGDRRRRGGIRVDDVIAHKQQFRELYGAPDVSDADSNSE
jgi:hypothetical protein